MTTAQQLRARTRNPGCRKSFTTADAGLLLDAADDIDALVFALRTIANGECDDPAYIAEQALAKHAAPASGETTK